MKNRLILILAVIVGLAAAGGTYVYLDNLKKSYVISGDFTRVAVARQRIPARTRITAQMIELKDIPAKYINELAAVSPEEIVGKIAKSEILPGEQILRDRLAQGSSATDGLAFMLQPGKRAVTVAVNEVSGLAGLIKPGDRVDVVGTFDLQGAPGQEKSSITSILIQDVDVLSTDQATIPLQENGQNGKKEAPARTVTLSVTPEQAQPLVLCSEKGTIRLILRPATDHEILAIPSIRMNQLVR
ncbi:MAG: Flp pilus assembly protein CpaB [Pelotomaculum sp.]|nr:Flp pilus assembly protein CpaB [Pelotomaculum sp.]